jgi:putative FmdB family regulatory protein
MPTYDYLCKECGHRFESFQSMSEPQLTICPACDAPALQRLIGAGAGLLFKGSGFYLTDYKKTGSSAIAKKPASSGETSGGSPDSGSSGGSAASGESAGGNAAPKTTS